MQDIKERANAMLEAIPEIMKIAEEGDYELSQAMEFIGDCGCIIEELVEREAKLSKELLLALDRLQDAAKYFPEDYDEERRDYMHDCVKSMETTLKTLGIQE